jgi:hypothetical protein
MQMRDQTSYSRSVNEGRDTRRPCVRTSYCAETASPPLSKDDVLTTGETWSGFAGVLPGRRNRTATEGTPAGPRSRLLGG